MKMGLVKASQGEFPEALEHLQAALPLVRRGTEKAGGAEDDAVYYEASILQNIGAIFNEMHNYSDAVAFHQEAAKLHSECLCTYIHMYRLLNLQLIN